MQKHRYTSVSQLNGKIVGRYTRGATKIQAVTDDSTENIPAHGSYRGLLFDPRWKAKRAEIIARDQGCCVICRDQEELQVHHRQYHFFKSENAFRMPWDYADHLLITLCKSCHQRGHSKFTVPTLIL